VGIRPGEKVHESLVSAEEADRTVERDGYYVIHPMLPELRRSQNGSLYLHREYSSADDVMTLEETEQLLSREGLMPENALAMAAEVLR
jgi:FlaA1/EpsC-like NDP-sugar epimerase